MLNETRRKLALIKMQKLLYMPCELYLFTPKEMGFQDSSWIWNISVSWSVILAAAVIKIGLSCEKQTDIQTNRQTPLKTLHS